MTPQDFNAWLDQLWFCDEDAAENLGVDVETIVRFRKEGAPHYIALACSAIERRLKPWQPRRRKARFVPRRRQLPAGQRVVHLSSFLPEGPRPQN
ncbi:hypothetical protein SAMN05428963_106205 [Consotaella salsifontis]|uniref:Uncharacterized protein n=1 Tax=Consotaella salsifontis TaxID=1365950 RepID=A0A1T4RD41_9HYPH|nr:hypothetical protein SAMN05428963_106205 [Consotaella salsifontis]